MTPTAQTLTERLAAGRLSAPEALNVAARAIESLRRMQESGRCHGALTPDLVVLGANGVDLLRPRDAAAITPYTAPEQIEGLPADGRSDLFSLGAMLYEMLTGAPAFSGATREELAESILHAMPPPLGNAALDRLLAHCLAKAPSGRWQRCGQAYIEVKIVLLSVRSAEAAARPRPETLRAELDRLADELPRLEARISERLDRHAGILTGLEQAAAQVPLLGGGLERQKSMLDSLQRVTSEQTAVLEIVSQTLNTLQDQMLVVGHDLVRARERGASQPYVENTLRAHAAAIDSIRAAMARTDDSMERVVGTIESLQTMMLESARERAA